MKSILFFQLLFVTIYSNQAAQWPLQKIHVMGDSHSQFCFDCSHEEYIHTQNGESYVVPFEIRYIGPRLAYSFGFRGCGDEKYFCGVEPNDYVVFSLGFVDVNHHYHSLLNYKKIVKRHGTIHPKKRYSGIEELVVSVVDIYMEKVLKYQRDYQFIPIIFGVIPPQNNDNDITIRIHPGTNDERVQYSLAYNAELKKRCEALGILYFDVFDEYAHENGTLKRKYIASYTHIKREYTDPVKKKLCDLILQHSN